jgi:ribose 5-phosphate isomerase A
VRPIEAPAAFARDVRALPGVVDAGLFIGVADLVLVGDGKGVQTTRRGERVA